MTITSRPAHSPERTLNSGPPSLTLPQAGIPTYTATEGTRFRMAPRGVKPISTRAFNPGSVTVKSLARQLEDHACAASAHLGTGLVRLAGIVDEFPGSGARCTAREYETWT